MSILARPSVVFAIVFACFAVLIPKVFLPIFRSKPTAPSHNNFDDHFRRPHPAMARTDNGDTIEHIPGTPPHMRGAHPSMRMHHPGANNREQPATDQNSSKSIVTLALPMYTVGIGVFFVYTCCKYWSKNSCNENKLKGRHLNNNPRWNNEKKKLKCDILDKDSEEEENKEDFYAGLDPDYIEYLKSKKQKALDAERIMTEEQKQMHYALEEMKKSLSFISSKLITKESRGSLDGDEIVLLQDRLASTEAQMCQILSALDAASDKVNEMTKTPKIEEEQKSVSASEDNQNETVSSSDENDHEWEQRNASESISSSDDDQSAPTDEQNPLIKLKTL